MGFAGLRSEILAFAADREEGLLQTAGVQGSEGKDPSSLSFIAVTDEREYPFKGPFMREASRSFLLTHVRGVLFYPWARWLIL